MVSLLGNATKQTKTKQTKLLKNTGLWIVTPSCCPFFTGCRWTFRARLQLPCSCHDRLKTTSLCFSFNTALITQEEEDYIYCELSMGLIFTVFYPFSVWQDWLWSYRRFNCPHPYNHQYLLSSQYVFDWVANI
jgi:hypothetical protein